MSDPPRVARRQEAHMALFMDVHHVKGPLVQRDVAPPNESETEASLTSGPTR